VGLGSTTWWNLRNN